MKSYDKLSAYLEVFTGDRSSLTPVPDALLTGLPVFLLHDYRFVQFHWLQQTLILAQAESVDELPPINQLKTQHLNMTTHFGRPVVFVFSSLDLYHRNRLVKSGIAFIVPGLQLFIPPFAGFCEHMQRHRTVKKLSAAGQAVVLSALYRQHKQGTLMTAWAKSLGYSAMTLSKVRQELASLKLCAQEDGRRIRGLNFLKTGQELWDSILPYLQSPVKNRQWVQVDRIPAGFVQAGLTLLSAKSMLQDDPIPTYACDRAVIKAQLQGKHLRLLEYPDDATAQIETWTYDPALFATDGQADPLSLYLSLVDSPEERIQQALTTLMEQIQW